MEEASKMAPMSSKAKEQPCTVCVLRQREATGLEEAVFVSRDAFEAFCTKHETGKADQHHDMIGSPHTLESSGGAY